MRAGHWMRRAALRGGAMLAAALPMTAAHADNPIVPGWYADPEIHLFDGEYWIYPTLSLEEGGPPRF